jgi:hypothetical protein
MKINVSSNHFIICFIQFNWREQPDFPLKIGYDVPNTIKIRANQLQSITQCNANTDLNFRLKFSKTTWPTEQVNWREQRNLHFRHAVSVTFRCVIVMATVSSAHCSNVMMIICDKVCQWLATGRWFSPGTPISSINKTNHHDITVILLKVTLNTINLIL